MNKLFPFIGLLVLSNISFGQTPIDNIHHERDKDQLETVDFLVEFEQIDLESALHNYQLIKNCIYKNQVQDSDYYKNLCKNSYLDFYQISAHSKHILPIKIKPRHLNFSLPFDFNRKRHHFNLELHEHRSYNTIYRSRF